MNMKRKVFILKFKDDTTPIVFTHSEFFTLRIEENNIDHIEATFITQYEFDHLQEWEG